MKSNAFGAVFAVSFVNDALKMRDVMVFESVDDANEEAERMEAMDHISNVEVFMASFAPRKKRKAMMNFWFNVDGVSFPVAAASAGEAMEKANRAMIDGDKADRFFHEWVGPPAANAPDGSKWCASWSKHPVCFD